MFPITSGNTEIHDTLLLEREERLSKELKTRVLIQRGKLSLFWFLVLSSVDFQSLKKLCPWVEGASGLWTSSTPYKIKAANNIAQKYQEIIGMSENNKPMEATGAY